jgi:hypothetical protein
MAWNFDTPGLVDADLDDSVTFAWHQWHATAARQNIAQMRRLLAVEHVDGVNPDTVQLPYADPSAEGIPGKSETSRPSWDGFPEHVTLEWGDDEALARSEEKGYDDLGAVGLVDRDGRLVHAPVRHRQDEYLEWEADHDRSGKLIGVTFVAEGWDYWAFLFEHDPERVVAAFQESTHDRTLGVADLRAPTDFYEVAADGRRSADPLIAAGTYNWRHPYNQGSGIRHLSHHANSLGAEVNLAVTSSLPRMAFNRNPVDGSDHKRLMCCTQGGDPNRSSDPHIAAAAYAAVSDKAKPKRFTLTNPIGLYIRSFSIHALKPPATGDRIAPSEMCRIERGTGRVDREPETSRVLRLRVAVPDGAGYDLGDMTIAEEPVTRAAQLAKLITMQLYVDTWDAAAPAPAITCKGGCCLSESGAFEPVRGARRCRGTEAFPELREGASSPPPQLAAARMSRRLR